MIMTEKTKRRAMDLAEGMAEDFDEEQAAWFSEKHGKEVVPCTLNNEP